MNIDLCMYRARIGMHRYRLLQVKGVKYFNNFELFVFLAMILYRAGDVEKNSGPENEDASDTSSSSTFPMFNGNFSVVHYNVLSVQHKLDIIEPEFSNFGLVSLTETWLNNSVLSQDLVFNDFQLPYRRDGVGDSHGGILVYVKTGISCK